MCTATSWQKLCYLKYFCMLLFLNVGFQTCAQLAKNSANPHCIFVFFYLFVCLYFCTLDFKHVPTQIVQIVFSIYGKIAERKQARKLQDAQAEKLTS